MRLKSFPTSAALILTTLMLVVAAATTLAAQVYTDLYNFDGAHGANPAYPALLAQGRNGNLYGTTFVGGDSGGVVFKITPSGQLSVLYKFEPRYGLYPRGGLTLGRDGNFYGTTSMGGTNDNGTIFKITPSGRLTTLYNFTGGTDGRHPNVPPIQGADGNFYGTAFGVVYKITPSGAFTRLSSLPSQESTDAPLLQGTDGNFYGTTYMGGAYKFGTVFKITPRGTLTIVHNFDGAHGSNPDAPVIQSSDGNFYGTTYQGGSKGVGVVFRLTPHGAIKVLHNLLDPNYPHDGYMPMAGLVQATDGNFYGTTTYGGAAGYGAIFKITPARAYSILYDFDANGANPESTPMQHTNGKIYGLTNFGGTHSFGVVYSFDVGLRPFVSLLPYSGEIGKTIEFLGQGFTGTTNVSFNGTAATFTVKSGTYLTAIVPNGATAGFVTVTTPRGTLKSNKKFRVKP